MERCPLCKARLKEPLCRRCHAELSILFHIETQMRFLRQRSIILLQNNDLAGAISTIKQAVYLKREPLTLALCGFIQKKSAEKLADTQAHSQDEMC